jgi:hypothetical protein
MKDHVAPIVLFSFNRPDKLKKLFNSLKKNKLSKKTIIYIFQDNYKNAKDKKNVKKCIRLINSIKYFKKKKIFLRKKILVFIKIFVKDSIIFFKEKKKELY